MAKAKSPMRVRKAFVDNTGARTPKPTGDWSEIVFELLGDKEGDEFPVVKDVRLARSELSESIFAIGAAHGFGQKVHDAFAGFGEKMAKEGLDPDDTEARVEYLSDIIDGACDNLVNGVWITAREGGDSGTRVTMLWAALVAYSEEMAGEALSEEQIAGLKAMLADDDTRAELAEIPGVKARVEEAKLERQKARLAKAQEAASAADPASNPLAALLGK